MYWFGFGAVQSGIVPGEIQQLIGTSYLAALEDPEMLREIQQMAQGQSAFENVLEVNDIENQNPWLGNPSW